jgi:hypothetical protein
MTDPETVTVQEERRVVNLSGCMPMLGTILLIYAIAIGGAGLLAWVHMHATQLNGGRNVG